MKLKFYFLTLLIFFMLASSVLAERFRCYRAKGKVSEERHYAVDRQVDVLHLKLEVFPNFSERSISGITTIECVPIAFPLKELTLHATNLTISSIEASVPLEDFQNTNEELILTFAEKVPAGKKISITIRHSAEPKEGLYFRTPEMGYLPEDIHLWTQGEMHEARHWFPSFDYPNERFTTEVICHVPPEMAVVSNGRLVSETIDEKTGLKAVRWLQEKPHVNYLIALVAGKLKKLSTSYQNTPLGFYTTTSQIAYAENSFRPTSDILAFFEKELDFPYAWGKYDQVVVGDFTWGGMENTSITILNDYTLFPNELKGTRSSQGLIAHEFAHQWFGDLVTCKDWSHIWLNEGFATFYNLLYSEAKEGRDAMLYGLYQDAQGILQNKDDVIPVVMNRMENMKDLFSFRAYDKGSWLLQMIRTQMGPDLYRKCIQEYLKRNQFKSVTTQDLINVLEEFSGLSWQLFFDQWAYHGGFPVLKIKYQWNEKENKATLQIEQTHRVDDKIFLFQVPTKVQFKTTSGFQTFPLLLQKREQDFEFTLASRPESVRFDPEYGVLAEVHFEKPREMYSVELQEQSDVIGRLLAIQALKSKKDQRTLESLQSALQKDSFYGVRLEASKALQQIHTTEALTALLASTHQPSENVRLQIIQDIGSFYDLKVLRYLKTVLSQEKNPDLLKAALQNLGKYPLEEIQETFLSFLNSNSFRQILVDATLDAISTSAQPIFLEPILTLLQKREKELPAGVFAKGLKIAGSLGRERDPSEKVFSILLSYSQAPRQSIRIAAIEALGLLKNIHAVPILKSFQGNDQEDSVQKALEEAIKKIQDPLNAPQELNEIRSALLKLEKVNEELRKEIDQLKRK
ncbi:MAG: M1 family metallopeptidase [Planctomycetota bacterium]